MLKLIFLRTFSIQIGRWAILALVRQEPDHWPHPACPWPGQSGATGAKGKKPRTVVLMPPVSDALKKHLRGRTQGWLFPGYKRKNISTVQVERILYCIAERSGLQEVVHLGRKGPGRYRIHPHLLRHSFAVWSLDNGVPVGDLQDQLGHASLATTGIYLKASPNHRREAYMRSGLSSFLAGKTP